MDSTETISVPVQINPNVQQLQFEQQNAWAEQQKIWAEKQKQQQIEKQDRFKKLGVATLLYALFYTFCMYENLAGITMPLWIMATIFYACHALKRFEISRKKDGLFHIAVMVLLGISTVLTGNPYIIFMNYVGFFLLLISFLLHTIYDDTNWGIGTYLLQITGAILGAIGHLAAPFSDGHVYRKLHQKKASKKTTYILLGFVMAVPSFLFLASLLASADAVFQKLLGNMLSCLTLPDSWMGALLLFAFAFLSAYCGLCQLLRKKSTAINAIASIPKLTSVIAIAFTAPITLLYVAFSLVQVFYLFLGFGTLPDGISYAEYARTGFFQLLFICFLNFILVLFVQNYVEESRLLRGILFAICGATFVMIASSAYRMLLYIGAYQLTFLRIFVLAALAIIALLMAGVVISLFKKHFPIYKYSLVVVSILYLGFSFSHVDYFIASYNLSHMGKVANTDTLEYIGTLSSDAAPAIADYMATNKVLQEKVDSAYQNKKSWNDDWLYDADADISWYLWYMEGLRSLSEHSSIRTFNVSHYIASKALQA